MKLYLTLEEGELKAERVLEINVGKEACEFDGIQDICDSMLSSLYSVKEEGITNEAKRLVADDKANS